VSILFRARWDPKGRVEAELAEVAAYEAEARRREFLDDCGPLVDPLGRW
jgi:hypothetical protein